MVCDWSSYNKMVNVSKSKTINATNFLESLCYKENAYVLLDVVSELETKFKSLAHIYPSFKGESALENGDALLEHTHEMYFESVVFKLKGIDGDKIVRYLRDNDRFSCVQHSKATNVVRVCIVTQRYLEVNGNNEEE
jgi:hypothetical protein